MVRLPCPSQLSGEAPTAPAQVSPDPGILGDPRCPVENGPICTHMAPDLLGDALPLALLDLDLKPAHKGPLSPFHRRQGPSSDGNRGPVTSPSLNEYKQSISVEIPVWINHWLEDLTRVHTENLHTLVS